MWQSFSPNFRILAGNYLKLGASIFQCGGEFLQCTLQAGLGNWKDSDSGRPSNLKILRRRSDGGFFFFKQKKLKLVKIIIIKLITRF